MDKRKCSIIERWLNEKNPVGISGDEKIVFTEEEKAEMLRKIRKIDDVEAYLDERFGSCSEKSPRS